MKRNYKEERLGKISTNKQGCTMKIVEYNRAVDIIVEFQDEYKSRVHTAYDCFIRGGVYNKNYRLGNTSVNFQGYNMKVIEYNNCDNITVEFDDFNKTRMKTQYSSFIDGDIKNLYHPNVYGVGYLGIGEHIAFKDGRNTKKYDTWNNMLCRSYCEEVCKKHPTYRNVKTIDNWHNFQIFGKWFDENYYEINGEVMGLDKDILLKHNKIYSPETCVFVPSNINALFTKREALRGDFPIGVHFRKDNGKYRALCSVQLSNRGDAKQKDLGQYDTPRCAFYAYKKYKEQHIKDIADYYKSQIPQKLYKALYRYKVEIED